MLKLTWITGWAAAVLVWNVQLRHFRKIRKSKIFGRMLFISTWSHCFSVENLTVYFQTHLFKNNYVFFCNVVPEKLINWGAFFFIYNTLIFPIMLSVCVCVSFGLSPLSKELIDFKAKQSFKTEAVYISLMLIKAVLTERLHWFSAQASSCCIFWQLVLFWSINSSLEE